MARSRGDAAELIAAGRVVVGGAPAERAARLVDPGESIAVARAAPAFVSRGGIKLAAALDHFGTRGLAVTGRAALDAGASTGGFTDCLLQNGARSVVAVDVGHGQLAWSLRQDPRVRVLERTNVRDLTADQVGGAVDIVTADLSFISLRTVATALIEVALADADHVLLVKPQFEAGPARVGKGGIVRDPAVRRAVLGEVVADLAAAGLGVRDVVASPITGADGNVEYLAWARQGPATVSAADLDAAVGARFGAPPGVGQTGR